MGDELDSVPPHQAARTRARRARRYGPALLVVLLAAAGAALLLAPTSGTARRRLHGGRNASGITNVQPPGPTTDALRPPGSAVRAQLAAVRRIARLGLPVFCGGAERRMVALTFDDGPGPYTRLAVRRLRGHHLVATFFLVGKQIRAYARLAPVEEPVAAFGDHTMTHAFLPALARSQLDWQIVAARSLIERVTGRPVVLFRPPYEGRTPAVDREVHALGMLEVLWNVDSRDSIGDTNYLGIDRNVIRGLRPGSIILMHENHGQTIRALPVIFAALARRGLRAVTVPELIEADPPSLRQLRRGLSGCPVSVASTNGG